MGSRQLFSSLHICFLIPWRYDMTRPDDRGVVVDQLWFIYPSVPRNGSQDAVFSVAARATWREVWIADDL